MFSQNGRYVRKDIYLIQDVLDVAIDPVPWTKGKTLETEVDFDGDRIYMDSHRYWCFKYKGTTCCECGLEGQFFAKERTNTKKPSKIERFHLNMYGVDADAKEVMLTKDHILPIAQGGKDHIDNYQTMCTHCNNEKGNMNAEQWEIYKSLKAGFLTFNNDQLQHHLKITVDTIKLMRVALREQGIAEDDFNTNDAYKKSCVLATAIRRIIESRTGLELVGGQNIWQALHIKI